MFKEFLNYNPETGIFTWAISKGTARVGSSPSSLAGIGYLTVKIHQKRYYLHRLAWFYVYNKWPGIIDHINGDITDNRIVNLRSATQRKNMQNRKSHREGRLVGAHRSGGKWRARFWVEGRNLDLGTFDTAIEAHMAYKKQEKIHESIKKRV